MASIPNITVEQLAEAFQNLSLQEKIKLFKLLPEDWFNSSEHSLTLSQKKALDNATKKELNGDANFVGWDEVKSYVKNRNA
ncbi:hypothetical protein [Galbibacter mesophilus]|uniref:hypothetical protein n=1 Tax=Galbibacter mesophilus TaxID=379069 RepID=UPI00191D5C2A|nr:hypothetical protein [Galbibacter mesophilus]MCM5663223.1 hypothetical protein [Galbibacter mesophilus]